MLAHILRSPKIHIIAYCRGAHLRAITEFLTHHANYNVVFEHNAGPMRPTGVEPEIDPDNILDAHHKPKGKLFAGLLRGVHATVSPCVRHFRIGGDP